MNKIEQILVLLLFLPVLHVMAEDNNGKELDRMHGLNTYDYGARQHDPILMRWDRMDPLCEKYYSVSPYAYCANNPVKYVDPDGRSVWTKGLKLAWKAGSSVAKNGPLTRGQSPCALRRSIG